MILLRCRKSLFLSLSLLFVTFAATPVVDVSTSALAGQRLVRGRQAAQASQPLGGILNYISTGWDVLTRSLTECKTFEDVKAGSEPILYLPVDFPDPPALREFQNHCGVKVQRLPRKLSERVANGNAANLPIGLAPGMADGLAPGLLYLEHPYVVPGGQFNEMYGWDSYFIIRGLLHDNRLELARGMVENFFFEIENYGKVLNANRTYYLTRSQPPFLSSMVLAVYDADRKNGATDLQWLQRAYGFVVRDYQQWNRAPHLAGQTGLSRYFDEGEGPVPEIMGDPSNYYRGVANFLLLHEGAESSHLVQVGNDQSSTSQVGPVFPVFFCDSGSSSPDAAHCEPTARVALTAEYYKGDRSMRESGFDVSFRFGPFSADTQNYAPDCLNSLLYKTEIDLETIATLLGRSDEAGRWRSKALARKDLITKYMWDGARGEFFDYDFTMRRRSSYEYATTFYPLWAGLASQEQARAVVKNLGAFEQAGGIAMSRRETKAQWDYPYGWAPIELLAAEGLRRYGYNADADRIAYKFLAAVLSNFRRDGTIREKYDVVAESSQTHIAAGYRQNVIGFGWTNGVFLELLKTLPPQMMARLGNETNP